MEDSEASSVRQLGNGLVQECHGLLSEIEQFERFLKERGRENVVELKPFQNAVRSELRSLENVGPNLHLSNNRGGQRLDS